MYKFHFVNSIIKSQATWLLMSAYILLSKCVTKIYKNSMHTEQNVQYREITESNNLIYYNGLKSVSRMSEMFNFNDVRKFTLLYCVYFNESLGDLLFTSYFLTKQQIIQDYTLTRLYFVNQWTQDMRNSVQQCF